MGGWKLARIVSMMGQLGIVSGTAIEKVLAYILMFGGPEAEILKATLEQFPFPEIAERVIRKYYKRTGVGIPVYDLCPPSRDLVELTICASWLWVHLARTNADERYHGGIVGMNLLTKMPLPLAPAIYGAMLAGVKVITMGAGLPTQIPSMLTAFCERKPFTYRVPVLRGNDYELHFDPTQYLGSNIPELEMPIFIPILTSKTGVWAMKRKTPKNSFSNVVIETHKAGGHNAPPRDGIKYGPEDEANIAEITNMGFKVWMGGSFAHPERLDEVLSQGGSGVQVGSAFALCDDSEMIPERRREMRKLAYNRMLKVIPNNIASPTGYPFEVVELSGTVADPAVYASRKRICIHAALKTPQIGSDGSLLHVCTAEPGGKEGTVCLCEALVGAIGLNNKPPIFTLGEDTSFLEGLMDHENDTFSASDVVKYVLGKHYIGS